MTRHFGAFIQNTLRSIVKEIDGVLSKCVYLTLTKEDIYTLIRLFLGFEVCKTMIISVTYLLLGLVLYGCVIIIMR